MNTLPKGYLFSVKNNKVVIIDKLFVPCNRYHPDTSRFVVLSESPCKENNFKSATVMARYIGGKYYGVTTGDELPVILDSTVWTESSIAEGPYSIVEVDSQHFYSVNNFTELSEAYKQVNSLNMQSMGDPGYTVVNKHGIPVDHTGHLYF